MMASKVLLYRLSLNASSQRKRPNLFLSLHVICLSGFLDASFSVPSAPPMFCLFLSFQDHPKSVVVGKLADANRAKLAGWLKTLRVIGSSLLPLSKFSTISSRE